MQNLLYMPQEARNAFLALKSKVEIYLNQANGLDERDKQIFLIRLERFWNDFYQPFHFLYSHKPDFSAQLEAIGRSLVENYAERSPELKLLDFERAITPDWFQRETMIGGIYYVDRFAGTLQGVKNHLEYLQDLQINYLHLMPLLKPRQGMNDGGYAVEDYFQVNPALGTMEDLAELSRLLHTRGMNLCVDLVVNHTAKEHEWARKAFSGDPEYLDYFFTFENRTLPDLYEKTLPEIFPDFAPGNFTWYPALADTGRWVWTTFNEFQWDLNYTNPNVFRGMLGYMLFLANQGVDILRLDAVPFMWKRAGTNCQNQPEVHQLLQAFRALVQIVAPAVAFKAEAIVAPHDLIHYLGTGRHTGKECQIAYNNSLMVLLWSTLATRKTALMTYSLEQMQPALPGTTWVTYVRLHDDIGWAITDENAGAVGENGFLHRRFLNEFYSGEFSGSFSRGQIFQANPLTGDGRMSGMTASLAGLERAIEMQDGSEIELAIRRILLVYSVIMSFGGIPLIYMGDELGMLNDASYLQDPNLANDNRWLHRPFMNWVQAAQRHDPLTVSGKIFEQMQQLVEARRLTRPLHSAGSIKPLWTDNPHIFAYLREYQGEKLLALCNFSEQTQQLGSRILHEHGLSGQLRDMRQVAQPVLNFESGLVSLEPYQTLWLTAI